ncbi:MAG: glutamyl-tRNA reductase [Gemmatimonadaceae bacterium]
MTIICVSLSHKTASVSLREQCAFSTAERDAVLSRFATGQFDAQLPFSELAILSTCNRVELYAALPENDVPGASLQSSLAAFFSESRSVDACILEPALRRFAGEAAAIHLCRVSAGLESMVVGESEILGQVGNAVESAVRHGSAGPVLPVVFRTAIRAGRRARSETAIGRNPTSVSTVAVHLAEEIAAGTGGRRVLLVGAGKMGARAADVLRSRGGWDISVASRSHERATSVAAAVGGCDALGFERLSEAIAAADIVITSSSAPHTIVSRELVEALSTGRVGRQLAFIDVAVPRDVEDSVRDVPGVRVFDMDDLQARVERTSAEHGKEIPRVEAIIREEMEDLSEWMKGRALAPILSDLRRRAEEIRQRELARTVEYLGGVEPEVYDQMDRLTRSLVSKLLHEPTKYLRSQAGSMQSAEYVDLARRLFGLADSGSEPTAPTELS